MALASGVACSDDPDGDEDGAPAAGSGGPSTGSGQSGSNGTSGSRVPPAAHYVTITSCGVTDAGTIQCWGLDNELGLATSPSGTDFAAVECSSTCCGLRKNGEVHCWGELEFDAQPLSEPAVQVVMIGTNRCLLMQSGRVQCVGPDQPSPAPTSARFVRASGGGQSNWRRAMCRLSKEGAIRCWGSQELERITPSPGPYLESANSTQDACGLRGDGKMECVTNFRGVPTDVHFADGSYLELQPSADRSTAQWGLLVTSPSSPYGGRVFCIGSPAASAERRWLARSGSPARAAVLTSPTRSTST